MQKRAESGRSRRVKCAAFSEIFILVLATVAFAFVLNESVIVSGEEKPASQPSTTQTGTGSSGGLWGALKSFFGVSSKTPPQEPGASTGDPNKNENKNEGPGAGATAGKLATGLFEGVTWAATVYGLVQGIAPAAGADPAMTKALSVSLAAGVFAGKVAFEIAMRIKGTDEYGAGAIGLGVFALTAITIFLIMYRDVKQKEITFTCMPWEAPIGGKNCEKCNGDPFRPCSEYRCRALGQACQLLNKERPGREVCAWVNPKETNSPTITPLVDALAPSGLKYIEDTSVRPPALGVKIVKASGSECLMPFTPLKFGIVTNELAQCKVDTNHTTKFEQMQYYFGGSNYYEYNHTETLRLPGPLAFNESEFASPILRNDGTMQLFVRCRDANGNENVDEYAIKFCVDPSPDTTPPLIEGASIANGNPIKFGTTGLSVDVYLNEPAECKWSVESKSYEDMETIMSCNNEFPQVINAVPTFVCVANLTGLKNNAANKYYFRCKDQPGKLDSERNVMVQSYEYTLKGSQPLNIVKVSPNGTISGSSAAVGVDLEVETDDGAEEGKAICSFSPTGVNGTYVPMFETNSFRHKQTLQLISGVYTYYFRCVDLGGNTVDSRTTFTVFSDLTAPKVARVYKEEGEGTGLKVVTDEDAECAYSLTNCNFVFGDGLKLIYSNPSIKTNSYLEWKPNIVYYVKCRDLYGNEPNPNECSVIVKAVEGSTA